MQILGYKGYLKNFDDNFMPLRPYRFQEDWREIYTQATPLGEVGEEKAFSYWRKFGVLKLLYFRN